MPALYVTGICSSLHISLVDCQKGISAATLPVKFPPRFIQITLPVVEIRIFLFAYSCTKQALFIYLLTILVLKVLNCYETWSYVSESSYFLSAVTPMCEEHDRPQDLFCKTCDELLCGNCLVESHANHIFSEAKDVMQEELDQLKCNHLEVAEEALLNMMTGETEVTVVIDEMKDRGEAVRKHIREYFRLIRDSLYQREEYLLTTADSIIKKKVDALQQQTDTLERCRRDLQGQIKMLNHMLLLRKDDVQFLIDKKRIMAEVESAVETARTKERTPTENTKDGPDYYLPMSLLEGTLNYTEVFCKPCPVRFTAFGENLTKAFVGVEASFTIQARDQYGLRSYKDGSTIDIAIKDPNSVDVECHISLPEQLLGEYVVHYTPKMLGVHNIVITADGQAITDSKSTVVVLQNRSRDYLLLDRPSCVIMKHQVHPEVSTMRGVCALPNNNIMFVDAFCLRIIAQDGTLVNTVGSYGNGPGQFTLPLGVAANKHGVIFASDSANHRVEKFSPEGKFLLSFGNQDTMNGCLDSPEGIALLAEEKVYVADRGNNRIQVFMQRNGKFAMGFGKKGNGPVQFNGPRALAVDTAWNRLLVTDCGNSRIQAVTLDGKPLMQFGTQGSVSLSNHFFPFCITTDQDGFVFVTETRSRSVLIFTPQGYLIKRLGEDLGLFRTPHGISVDTQGQVIVTDASSHRMYFFKLPSL